MLNITKQQLAIALHLANGFRQKQVATKLGIALKTVEAHMVASRQKTGAKNGVHLVAMCFGAGLLQIDPMTKETSLCINNEVAA